MIDPNDVMNKVSVVVSSIIAILSIFKKKKKADEK